MTGPLPVLLDACVLANFSLCDTLLRLAEPPRLYEPRWGQQIIAETTRAFAAKLNWPRHLVAHFETVADYNRKKDRVTIEDTFAKLVDLMGSLHDEQRRAAVEVGGC